MVPITEPSMTAAYVRQIIFEMKLRERRKYRRKLLKYAAVITGLFIFMLIFSITVFLIFPPGAEWALDLFGT